MRDAIEQRYEVSREDNLKAVKKMGDINAPVTSWEQMKREYEGKETAFQ